MTLQGWVCHYFNLCVLQFPPSQRFLKLLCLWTWGRWKEKTLDGENKGQNRYVTRLYVGPHNKGTRNPRDLLEWKIFLPLLQLIHHLQEEMCLGKVEDSCKFTNNYNNMRIIHPHSSHTQLTYSHTFLTHIHSHTHRHTYIQAHTSKPGPISHTVCGFRQLPWGRKQEILRKDAKYGDVEEEMSVLLLVLLPLQTGSEKGA